MISGDLETQVLILIFFVSTIEQAPIRVINTGGDVNISTVIDFYMNYRKRKVWPTKRQTSYF